MEAGQGVGFAVRGRIMHAPARGVLDLHEDAVLVVDGAGAIEALHPSGSPAARDATGRAAGAGRLLTLAPLEVLLPGLVDLHVHAPQWPQAGRALDLALRDWLVGETFPLERRCEDPAYAETIYRDLVCCLLANGTTTAAYFASLHEDASLVLARLCLELGQRALVGRVAMDDPGLCPPWLRDRSAAEGVAATRRFIEAVRALPGNEAARVRPLVTPRFIPSCSDALLRGLGELAASCGCAVQTHCSESDWADEAVRARTGRSDTAALDGFGLLRPGSILAHCNLVDDADLGLIRARGAAIAHCPISNAYFAGAVLPLRRILDAGVSVGLGSDLAGGYSPQLLDNAREAMIAARLAESGTDPRLPPRDRGAGVAARISAAEAFWLATAGGGEALGLPVGCFLPGFGFDAVLFDAGSRGSNLRVWPGESAEDLLERLVRQAGRSDIARVWVQGRLVHEARA